MEEQAKTGLRILFSDFLQERRYHARINPMSRNVQSPMRLLFQWRWFVSNAPHTADDGKEKNLASGNRCVILLFMNLCLQGELYRRHVWWICMQKHTCELFVAAQTAFMCVG